MTKNKIAGLALLLTITLGSILWIGGNLAGLPESHPFWTVVTAQIGVGFFVVVPVVSIWLLRLKR